MAKRDIENSFGGRSLGKVTYAPVRGHSHTKQDPVALLTQYMGVYRDAMNFAKKRCASNRDKIPDVTKAQHKSADWYAGMIANACNVMRMSDDEEKALCRDAICAIYAEAVASGAASPLMNDGIKYRKGNIKRAAKLDTQNRATASEAEQRKKDIIAAADTAFPDRGNATRGAVIENLYRTHKENGWTRSMIKSAIRGKFGQRAKA